MFKFVFSAFAPRGIETRIADIINPEVLADQISAKYPDLLVFAQSGLVEVDSTFALGTPGTIFTIPFWKRIGDFASLTEGTAMVPGKITTGKETAVVQRAGLSLEVLDTAQLVSKTDPMTEIRDQLATKAAKYLDEATVTECNKTPNVYDGTASADNSGKMHPNLIINGLISKLGDNYSKILAGGGLIMHSKVVGDLMQLGVIQNNYQSNMDVLKGGVLPTLLGLPIFISDKVTTGTVSAATVYNTYIVGPGALALFFQRNIQVEFDRDVLKSSDIVAATVHFAPHLFGWDDNTNAQACEDAKSIHAVIVKSK